MLHTVTHGSQKFLFLKSANLSGWRRRHICLIGSLRCQSTNPKKIISTKLGLRCLLNILRRKNNKKWTRNQWVEASKEAARGPTTPCLPCLNRMIFQSGRGISMASLEQARNKYSFYHSTSVSAGAGMDGSINLPGVTTWTDNLKYTVTLWSLSATFGAASSAKGYKSSVNTSEVTKTRIMWGFFLGQNSCECPPKYTLLEQIPGTHLFCSHPQQRKTTYETDNGRCHSSQPDKNWHERCSNPSCADSSLRCAVLSSQLKKSQMCMESMYWHHFWHDDTTLYADRWLLGKS